MNLLSLVQSKLSASMHWFFNLSLLKKSGVVIVLLVLGFLLWTQVLFKNSNQPTYQTGQVTRGTLVVSLTESGQVAVANRM
ncbi:MAG: hypothetical protein ACHQT7_02420, partial [Candidatus Levyibacteriota bacterium]